VNVGELFADVFTRISDAVDDAVEGLSVEQLAYRPGPQANSIAWLVWHLTRVQDDHICDVAGVEQAWTSLGWAERFGLPLNPSDTGYGHTSQQVGAVRATSELLIGYHAAVKDRTLTFVRQLVDKDLDRVVDRRWDPPVTLGVRLVSVGEDDLQHAGQAAYVRGLVMQT
jgi:uncharacterized damage-inducible protein DinB